MAYNSWSPYYTPRTRAELIKQILPHWAGFKKDLREMSTCRLRAIYHRIKQKNMEGLMRK